MKANLTALLFALIISAIGCDERASAPATNQLIGRWRLISMGDFESPGPVIWEFDKDSAVVTSSEGVMKSHYTRRAEGDHQLVYLTKDGEKKPNRIFWYEIKEGKLGLHLVLDGEKPTWSEKIALLLEPVQK